MNYSLTVYVFACFYKLVCVVLSFDFVQSASSLDHITQRLVLTQIKHYIHVLSILEVLHEIGDILMVKGAMDLYFTCQLLTSFASGQIGLGNNFECIDIVDSGGVSVTVNFSDLITLSKATLAQKFTTEITIKFRWVILVSSFLFFRTGSNFLFYDFRTCAFIWIFFRS